MSAPVVITGATFSPCQTFRYSLERVWNPDGKRCLFIGFNPSTADALEDDPTIRRCIGFARSWGYGAMAIVNLFAVRSKDPSVVRNSLDPVGPMNDAVIEVELRQAHRAVAAWGALANLYDERAEIIEWLAREAALPGRFVTIGPRTKSGHPRHPLYLRAGSAPHDFVSDEPLGPPAAPAR